MIRKALPFLTALLLVNVHAQAPATEQEVIADAKGGWNKPLADALRAEIRDLASGWSLDSPA